MSILNRQDDEIEIDLVEVFRLLLGKWHFIIISMLIFGLVVFAGTFFLVTPQYEANTTLYVNNSVNRENSVAISQSDLIASAHLVDTYAAIIKSRTVLEQVLERANVEIEIGNLQKMITAKAINDTEVFMITVKDSDPHTATRIANAIAEIAPGQCESIVEGSSVKVVDYAELPTEIASPSYKIATLAGMLVGGIFSVAFIVIQALLDTTIKSEDDFKQWDYPVLCVIPDLDEAIKHDRQGYGYGYGRSRKR